MEIELQPERLLVQLNGHEIILLLRIFESVHDVYTAPKETLSNHERAQLYPITTPDADPHWHQELRSFRGDLSLAVERWMLELANLDPAPTLWTLPRTEVESLLVVLNDHRLYRASQHEVDEALMSIPIQEIESEKLQHAMLEIHFLAWFIDSVLKATYGEPLAQP